LQKRISGQKKYIPIFWECSPPDAVSGLCSSSPLAIREIGGFTNIPVLQSMKKNYKKIFEIIG
jgi:hypothetical protein